MARFAAASVALVLLTSMPSYALIEASFALNRDAIAARYCVNRDRPGLPCGAPASCRGGSTRRTGASSPATLLGIALSAAMWPAASVAPPPVRVAVAHARPSDRRAAGGVPSGVFHPPKQA